MKISAYVTITDVEICWEIICGAKDIYSLMSYHLSMRKMEIVDGLSFWMVICYWFINCAGLDMVLVSEMVLDSEMVLCEQNRGAWPMSQWHSSSWLQTPCPLQSQDSGWSATGTHCELRHMLSLPHLSPFGTYPGSYTVGPNRHKITIFAIILGLFKLILLL